MKKQEDFWIHKLKTLKPHGFNSELISLAPVFVVQISLRRPYAEQTVLIQQHHGRRKTGDIHKRLYMLINNLRS